MTGKRKVIKSTDDDNEKPMGILNKCGFHKELQSVGSSWGDEKVKIFKVIGPEGKLGGRVTEGYSVVCSVSCCAQDPRLIKLGMKQDWNESNDTKATVWDLYVGSELKSHSLHSL